MCISRKRSATVCPFFHAGEKQEVPLYDIGVFYLSLPTNTLLLVVQRRVLNEDEQEVELQRCFTN